MAPIVMGLTGYAGAGKSAAAEYLELLYGFSIVSFADPLRDVALRIGWDGTKRPPDAYPNGGVYNGRLLLQELGVGMRISVGPNVWVDVARRRIEALRLPPACNVVIPDVRFSNEVALVREFGGAVVRIDRPGLATMEHVTERPEDLPADYVVSNDGTHDELCRSIADVALKVHRGASE